MSVRGFTRGYIADDGGLGIWSFWRDHSVATQTTFTAWSNTTSGPSITVSWDPDYTNETSTWLITNEHTNLRGPPANAVGLIASMKAIAAQRALPGLLPPWPTPARLVSRSVVAPRRSVRSRAAGSPSWARRK